MIFSFAQLIAHMIGDYLFQSHWMATSKRARSAACLLHVIAYGAAFVLVELLDGRTLAGKQIQTFKMSMPAFLVIVGTHFVIDRWGLARYVCAFKNWQGGPHDSGFDWYRSQVCDQATGFPKETPQFLAVWLLIICDNIMHVVINAFALWCL
jgi:hypothetical protein